MREQMKQRQRAAIEKQHRSIRQQRMLQQKRQRAIKKSVVTSAPKNNGASKQLPASERRTKLQKRVVDQRMKRLDKIRLDRQTRKQGDTNTKPANANALLKKAGQGAKRVSSTRKAGTVRNVNPKKGTENCVNCAIVTDARLAGRSASALLSGPVSISVLETTFKAKFRPISGKMELHQIMKKAGPGARGIVFGGRRSGVGHVFNVTNQNGVVRYIDGQTGKEATFNG